VLRRILNHPWPDAVLSISSLSCDVISLLMLGFCACTANVPGGTAEDCSDVLALFQEGAQADVREEGCD